MTTKDAEPVCSFLARDHRSDAALLGQLDAFLAKLNEFL
jgi:hypothetical protein